MALFSIDMTKNSKDYFLYRFWEIIPGALVWLTFILAIGLSLWQPLWGIYFILIFDVYWVLRVTYLLVFLLLSWRKFRQNIKLNWFAKLKTEFGNGDKVWSDYRHIIFLPMYKEPLSVVEDSFQSLIATDYDHQKFLIVLAGEGGAQDHFEQVSSAIVAKYKQHFFDIVVTIHPKDIEGELRGKGSNLYWAGNKTKEYVDQQGWDYKKIIVSAFDIDTRPHEQYFSYLTYAFLTSPNPYRTSFQPLTLYHNNIWESDLVTRVVANSTTFWLMTDLARADRLFTFSSHSMSWQALVDVGFWQNNIVTEDSRIFLQCLIHYDGDYRVTPMYMTVSMDTVYVGSVWKSLLNQYKQMRRWAWGVEHYPYMMWHFRANKKIPRKKALIYIFNQTEGVYSWATAPILIFIMGRLPLYMTDRINENSALAQAAPLILSNLMTAALAGLVVTAFMSVYILPKCPYTGIRKFWAYSMMLVQWIFFPITMILWGSIPAIDAQTRLMVGAYMGFWVTEKTRVGKSN